MRQNTNEYKNNVGTYLKNKGLFPYPFLHWDFVVVTNGVFTQEVELHHILLTVILWI